MYLISEIGINHNGSLGQAEKLIDAAIEAGADAVKFQKRTIETCIPRHLWHKQRETPWGTMTYIEYKERLEFDLTAYKRINQYCKGYGIDWSASVWDEEALDFLEQFDPPWHKVASAMNTNLPLLQAIAHTGRPVILSTAMADEKGVRRAVDVFGEGYDLTILHCVGSYPASDEDLNLRNILTLKAMFPWAKIGYSNHSPGAIPCIVAAGLGAEVIEAHITLDRSSWGSDQAASLEPGGFKYMAKHCRNMEVMLGDAEIRFLDVEKKSADNLRWFA